MSLDIDLLGLTLLAIDLERLKAVKEEIEKITTRPHLAGPADWELIKLNREIEVLEKYIKLYTPKEMPKVEMPVKVNQVWRTNHFKEDFVIDGIYPYLPEPRFAWHFLKRKASGITTKEEFEVGLRDEIYTLIKDV